MAQTFERLTSRRRFLSSFIGSTTVLGGMALLAACGRPAEPAAPTGAPAPAGAPAATSAPAAAAATTAPGAAAATKPPAAAATQAPAAGTTPTVPPTEVAPVLTVAPTTLGKTFNNTQIRVGASTEYYAYALRIFQGQVEKELGVKLSIDVVPGGDLYQRNITEFSSGSSSYDMFMLLPFQLPDYAAHLEPLDTMKGYGLDFKLDDVMPIFRDVYSTWGGQVVSMPFDGDVHLLMYNKEAFDNADLQKTFKSKYNYDLKIPETYDQYLDIGQFFGDNAWRKDGQKGFGIAEGFGGPEWWWENRFASYGGVYFDENMNPLINSKNGLAATDNIVKAAKLAPPGSNSFGYQEAENALVKGDAAMSINWSSAYRTSTNPQKSTTVGKIGTAVPPGSVVNGQTVRHAALCTGWSLAVPKYAKNKEAASYVMWFYSQPSVHTQFILDADTGIDAYRVSSLNDPTFATKYGAEYVKTINDALSAGFPDLQVPNSAEYYQKLDNGLKDAIAGAKPTKDAMDTAADEWKKITQRMGGDKQKEAWTKAYQGMQARGIKYIPMA